jgi:hypothetical protein
MTKIKQLNPPQARAVLDEVRLDDIGERTMDFCLLMSTGIWGCFVDDRPICIYGVIPPTLMSHQAYLWMFATDFLKEHQFVLVRQSQIVIENLLKEYPVIVGHAIMGSSKSIRWLKWLGAKFGTPHGTAIPFRIERHG